VSDEALIDAMHVCALFNMIVRIADSFEFHVPPPEIMAKDARSLLKRGYK
jgi:hypothetical protein